MTDEGFTRVCEYVEDELQFATSHYNDSYLDRRISSRMRRTRTSSYDNYLTLLQEDPEEQEALLDSMSINVTGFFRNPEVWDGLRNVLARLTDERDSVAVWSAACADGREPYSVSMLALEDPDIDEQAVSVVGTDISEPALETAMSGVYRSSRTVDIDEQLSYLEDYERYVERRGRHFEISDAVAERVQFKRHDLINDHPLGPFDLVICRNLFIYIDTEYKEEMLETIGGSLREDGYLVIGKAETIPPDVRSGFSVEEGRLRIYQRESEQAATNR